MSSPDLTSVMRNAREDLLATVEGRFSPDDWDRILAHARGQLESRLAGSADPLAATQKAWEAVILDFHRSRYWGFSPDYRAPKARQGQALGIRLIWMTFITFTITKTAVVCIGQTYTNTGERRWLVLLVLTIAASLAGFGWFLWRHRHHGD